MNLSNQDWRLFCVDSPSFDVSCVESSLRQSRVQFNDLFAGHALPRKRSPSSANEPSSRPPDGSGT